jgi:uncharacterized protein (DUF1499 family)
MRIVLLALLVAFLLLTGLLFRAARTAPVPAGGALSQPLPECPGTPNCVRVTYEGTAEHPPFRLAPGLHEAGGTLLVQVESAVEQLPRTRITEVEVGRGFYLRAESRSRVFGFVDDLEIRWDGEAEILEVRSASRVGRSDLGVNGERVEALRSRLMAAGTLAP